MSVRAPAALRRGELLYAPTAESVRGSRIADFRDRVRGRGLLRGADYRDLWEWSIEDPEAFWNEVIDVFELDIAERGTVLADREPPRAQWMPGARLSYPEHALRAGGPGPALVGLSQSRERTELSGDELRDQVARCAAGLAGLGVGVGDRVVGYLPNIPEAVVAFLATASLGAVWASCPPEFGPRAVIDRFAQIEPSVLLVVDGYRYGDKVVDRREAVAAIRDGLPTLRHTVLVDYLDGRSAPDPGVLRWPALLAGPARPTYARVDFDHPLYVLFSSGTTGLPKAIVHGHGGILLEHVKALGLQNDVRAGDRFFWQSTTGWMVWNYAVSALVLGATMICFDGHPAHPGPDALWQLVADESVTYFGTSAGHLTASAEAGLSPAATLDLRALRGIGSTGSPLPADGFRWVFDAVGGGVHLSSLSGGTDICSAFVGGSVLSPVRAGEISAPTLGCHVVALNADGRPVVGEFGELSVLAPMPSMPVALWGDADGSRLRETYFSCHPGIWSHGDWVVFHEDLSCVITGRSDATLNRGGVRLGTSEFYAVVDEIPEVTDSLVVHLEDEGAGELVLLVSTAPGVDAEDLAVRIRSVLRVQLSPRHVPDRLIRLDRLPRTLTGKRLEQPVKRILLGADPDAVASRDSIQWPESLAELVGHSRTSANPGRVTVERGEPS
jgi:acetoacetyl-CoA synthetase